MTKVRLIKHWPERLMSDAVVDPARASEQFDLALLESGWDNLAPISLQPDVLPTGDWNASGFQDQHLGFVGAVHLSGTYSCTERRRYFVNGRDYFLAKALDLDGSAVHGGTSGAAVVDKQTQSIVGVIVGSLASFVDSAAPYNRSIAVSISDAVASWPPLRTLCQSVDREVPRFGTALNCLGASLLCRAQRLATLDDLTAARYVDPSKLRPRDLLDRELRCFLADAAPLMPIIGDSGVGKTSIAALLSGNTGLRYGLLLRGVHMRAGDTTIATQIERALADEEYGTHGLTDFLRPDLPRPDAITLARIAAEAGEPLVIVLDGINERDEVLLPAQRIAREWMPRTVEWLRRNNSKLILTCRPETWPELMFLGLKNAVFPPPRTRQRGEEQSHPVGISRPPQGGLWVGDLSADELPQMIQSYGLDGRIDPADARHPFFLRLAAELETPIVDTPARLSHLDLIEAALDTRANEIKRLYPRDVAGAREVRLFISGIAEAMLIDGTDSLSATSAAALPLANSNLLHGLFDFGVLERVGLNYRFRFDQYADAERSRLLALPLAKDLSASAHRLGEPQLRSTIAMAAERMYAKVSFSSWHYPDIATDSAPIPLRFGLLIELARIGENGFGLRVKDWEDRHNYGERFYDWIDQSSFGNTLKALYVKESRTVLRLLMQRLDDERPIVGHDNREATVSSLCGGCLCAIAGGELRNYTSELLANRSRVAESVLRVALRRNPQTLAEGIVQLASQLAEHPEVSSDENKVFLSELLNDACQLVPTVEFCGRAVATLRNWTDDAESARVRSVAAAAILKLDPTDVAAFDRLLVLLTAQSSDSDFLDGVRQLDDVPECRRREVVELLLARLNGLAGQWNTRQYGAPDLIFNFLERRDIGPIFARNIINVLQHHASRAAEDNRAIAQWALRTLREIEPADSVWSALFDLLDVVLQTATEGTELTLVDYAYCDLPIQGDAAARTRQLLSSRKLSSFPLSMAVLHSAQWAARHPADDCVKMLSVLRPSQPLQWDQCVRQYLRSECWRWTDTTAQFAQAVLRYWRALPNSELTEVSMTLLSLEDRGFEVRDLFCSN